MSQIPNETVPADSTAHLEILAESNPTASQIILDQDEKESTKSNDTSQARIKVLSNC
jgi:hypothetical protein